ncbi:hypothetical protein KQH82_10425 [bacterium]|nr:hypothetical protein [bacterium]
MKKMCIGLLLAAMLVCVFAPGVSARSRPLWMDQLQDHADTPQGEEGGWGSWDKVSEPDHSIFDSISYWVFRLFRTPVVATQTEEDSKNLTTQSGSNHDDSAK